MKQLPVIVTLELALMTTAIVSASASAENGASGTASAIVSVPVNVSDKASVIAPEALVSDDCLQNAKALVSCFKPDDENGVLDGDPVSSIMVNSAADAPSARGDVNIIVTYD